MIFPKSQEDMMFNDIVEVLQWNPSMWLSRTHFPEFPSEIQDSAIIRTVLRKLEWSIDLPQRTRVLSMNFLNYFMVFWNYLSDLISFEVINVDVSIGEGDTGYSIVCMANGYLNDHL